MRDAAAGLGDDVLDHAGDQPADEFMDTAGVVEPRVSLVDPPRMMSPTIGTMAISSSREQFGAQAVVDVVGVIGDVVGKARGPLPPASRLLSFHNSRSWILLV